MAVESELQDVAKVSLREYLTNSCIPQELWDTIEGWLADTGLLSVYLDPEEAIGAWWGSHEADTMGFVINFPKCGILPSEWCPKGTDWDVANGEAKYRFVASCQQLLDHQALEAVYKEET